MRSMCVRVHVCGNRGRSNLLELAALLAKTIHLRRLKADVLDQLPPKQRSLVRIPPDTEFVKVCVGRVGWGLCVRVYVRVLVRASRAAAGGEHRLLGMQLGTHACIVSACFVSTSPQDQLQI